MASQPAQLHHRQRFMQRTALVMLCYLYLTTQALAAPVTPEATDVVAQWDHDQASQLDAVRTAHRANASPETAVQLASAYLSEAGKPGQARLYGLAEALLEPWIEENNPPPGILLNWARVQQHKHNFELAMRTLERVLADQPQHISANLMAARISLVQGNPEAAKQFCLRLFGHADLLTVSACSMEAASVAGKLETSYQQLSQLVEQHGVPEDSRGPWLSHMLSDMAMRLDKPAQAAEWLRQPLAYADVSYLAEWADVQLALGAPKNVLNRLGPIVSAAPAMDDALLLRLAEAEQRAGASDRWQAHLAARVALREQRQDTQHASDLAQYYLGIDPQPEKALHWARLNWQHAREPADKALLEKATALAEQAPQIHTDTDT